MSERKEKDKKHRARRGKMETSRSFETKGKGVRGRQPARRQTAVYGVRMSDNSTLVKMAQPPLFNARSKHKELTYFLASVIVAPSTGAAAVYVMSANGLYDPDISGTGNQPRGFDQMMIFYEHYTVFRARLVVTFRCASANASPTVFIAARGDSTNVPSYTDVMEDGNAVSTQLMPGSVAGSLKELSMSVDVGAFLGADDLMDFNVGRGDLASNPAEGVFFHIGAFNPETFVSCDVRFTARIVYDAVFTEARVITPSLMKAIRPLIMREALLQEALKEGYVSEEDKTTFFLVQPPPQFPVENCTLPKCDSGDSSTLEKEEDYPGLVKKFQALQRMKSSLTATVRPKGRAVT